MPASIDKLAADLGLAIDEAGNPTGLACTECGSSDIREHDVAHRYNRIDYVPQDKDLVEAIVVKQDDEPDWEHVRFFCWDCDATYDVPNDLVIEWI